jgi:hypothetical protein
VAVTGGNLFVISGRKELGADMIGGGQRTVAVAAPFGAKSNVTARAGEAGVLAV